MPNIFIGHNEAKYALISNLTRPGPARPDPARIYISFNEHLHMDSVSESINQGNTYWVYYKKIILQLYNL